VFALKKNERNEMKVNLTFGSLHSSIENSNKNSEKRFEKKLAQAKFFCKG